ncbi:MAG: outer membrane beta-barrel protein [Proteobacteria bacterium]|nr:outer membrane beta-barrel protein [Pseudomonadota bacterium]
MKTGRHLPLAALIGAVAAATGAVAGENESKFHIAYQIEVAGADESDRATKKELKDSGTNMVPAKKAAAPVQPAPPTQPKPAVEPAKSADVDAKPAAPAKQAQSMDKPAMDKPKVADATAGEFKMTPYIRIDAGYALLNEATGNGRNGTNRATTIQNTGFAGVGFGYHLEENVRMDGTFTYRAGMEIDGKDGASSTVSGQVNSVSAMLNLYYDFNQAHDWLGSKTFTPYVGAGAGISMLKTDSLNTTSGPTERGTEVYNLACAAMAGMGVSITEKLTADFGYRFINLGQFEQDGSFSTGITGAATKFDDLMAHEFHAGLRLAF